MTTAWREWRMKNAAYDGSNPQKLVSKKLTSWTKKTYNTTPSSTGLADWHPRVTQEESIVYDNAGNGVSATAKYEYEDETTLTRDKPLLQKKAAQYAFVTAGSAPPSVPVRTSESVFLINDTAYPEWVRDIYKMQNMIGLVSSSVIKDGAGTIVSRSEMKYDDGSSSPNIGRGNPTSLRVWDNMKEIGIIRTLISRPTPNSTNGEINTKRPMPKEIQRRPFMIPHITLTRYRLRRQFPIRAERTARTRLL